MEVCDYISKIAPIECDFSAANFNGGNIPSQAISQGVDALLLAPSFQGKSILKIKRY